jgi:hypothetical protein
MTSFKKTIDDLNNSAIIDIFETHYLKGHMSPISLDEIPAMAMEQFEGYSSRFIPPYSYVERNFERSFSINDDTKMTTYVVTQNKKYTDAEISFIEKQIYLFATDQGDVTLHSEIRFNITSEDRFFKDKPFVGYSGCESNFYYSDDVLQKVWLSLGVEQVKVMNALSHAFFGLPIHSDTLLCAHEEPLWEELLRRGDIQSYIEGEKKSDEGKLRYVFNDSPKLYKHDRN